MFQDYTIKSKGDRCIILDISTNNEVGWIRYNIESGAEGLENRFVIVGETEGNIAVQQYYILVVVLTGENGEYRRVGVRMVGTDCVEKLGSGMRIV